MQNNHDARLNEILDLFKKPFMELIYEAHKVHLENFPDNKIQVSVLRNIKTGGCSENCHYCSQSAHHKTGIQKQPMDGLSTIIEKAKQAKEEGATRFCMAASGRSPKENELNQVIDMIKAVKELGLEACVTLGMLTDEQAEQLKEAGLDYYNHNLDTSPEYYQEIITTRTFQDRLDTLNRLHKTGLKTCSGGIIGMGETVEDRAKLLLELLKLPKAPESIPINSLMRNEGTPLGNQEDLDSFDKIRMIAVTRILFPKSYVRLSAGRISMTDEAQALCFFAGANSIFYGEKLLTTPNPDMDHDRNLLKKLDLKMCD
jgi:biotin synthase